MDHTPEMANDRLVLFVDTSSLLHFQWLADIDWLELAGSAVVEILLDFVVIEELDAQKRDAARRKVRERARSLSSRLDPMLGAAGRCPLREGVELRLNPYRPLANLAELNLDPHVNDDRLIASIKRFEQENHVSPVALVTNDFNLRFKAQQHGIRVLRLPEHYSLPEEQDELEAKFQRAEREVQLLKNRLPELLLTFPDGAIFKQFAISAPVVLTKEEIAVRIAELRAKYSTDVRRETPRMGTGLMLTPAAAAAAMAAPLSDPTEEEIARYKRELKGFFAEYEQYWMKSRDHTNIQCRAIELSLTLQNRGTAPAEDIRLSLSLPDGLTVYDKKGRPSGPQPPAAPHPPRGLHEQMIAALRSNATFLYRDPTFPIYPIRCNVSPPSIKKRTNGFLVEFSIEKLIQHRPESLDPLYLLFDSFDSGESFHIDWRGVSASLPQPVTGRLDVVVQKIAA